MVGVDPPLVRSAKRLLPPRAKALAGSGLRAFAMATSPARMLPGFMLAGAKRCGSTSLYAYLLEHPDVAPLFPAAEHKKGTHYFDRHPEKSLAWYRSHFPLRHNPRIVAGEASTYYFAHPYAARRAAETAPQAKIIILLREPVERAFSHYRDEVKLGHETLPFADAVRAEKARLAPELQRLAADPHYYSFAHEHLSYVSWGQYAEHLRRWFDAFPREQVLVLPSEDLYTAPEQVFTRVSDFLGLLPYQPEFRRHNAAPPAVLDDDVADELRAHYAPWNAQLRELLPAAPGWA